MFAKIPLSIDGALVTMQPTTLACGSAIWAVFEIVV